MNIEKIDFLWDLYMKDPEIYKYDDYSRLARDLVFDKDVVIEAVDMMIADYNLKINLLIKKGENKFVNLEV